MKNTPKLILAYLIILISLSVSAQTYSGFSDRSIVLKSDTTTKSVLISNLLEDRVGDISPIIGAAAWSDHNKKLQCRSLLYFNYGILPLYIRPDQITEAKLILRPVEINTIEQASQLAAREFIVRRVVEPWEDSMTSWLTQPASNPGDETIKSISENKIGKPVRIDVTEIVKNMFRYGNNGFMISYRDSVETSSFLSQWFASARYEKEKLRPELIISWSYPLLVSSFPNDDFPQMTPIPRDLSRGAMAYANMYTGQEPVPVPVIKTDDPAPPPPKDPIKPKENK